MAWFFAAADFFRARNLHGPQTEMPDMSFKQIVFLEVQNDLIQIMSFYWPSIFTKNRLIRRTVDLTTFLNCKISNYNPERTIMEGGLNR